MEILETQICIVGAGPGGISAAISLARRNVPCIVVDKANFPRHKADGDALTSNVVRSVYQLDPDLHEEMKKLNLPELNGFDFNSVNGRKISLSLISPANEKLGLASCYVMRRYDFDLFMLNAARKYEQIRIFEDFGIHSWEKKDGEVWLYDRERTRAIRTRFVIIASGSGSMLSRSMGGFTFEPKQFAAGIRAYFSNVEGINPAHTEYLVVKELLPGGLCIVPLSSTEVAVSISMRSKEVSQRKINMRLKMLEVLKTHPSLKDRFKNAKLVGDIDGSPLHLGVKNRKIAGDQFVMVGDAAGLAEPISANGIGHAMITGMMAADQAIECIQLNDFSEKVTHAYTKKVHKRLENSLKMGRIGYMVFGYPKLMVFISNRITWFSGREAMNELLFASNIWKVLLKPSFYYRLLTNR